MHNVQLFAGIAQLVEHLTCNQGVPSSTLGAGTILTLWCSNTIPYAGIAQLVEHLTCNQGVPSSTLGAGTKFDSPTVLRSDCYFVCRMRSFPFRGKTL